MYGRSFSGASVREALEVFEIQFWERNDRPLTAPPAPERVWTGEEVPAPRGPRRVQLRVTRSELARILAEVWAGTQDFASAGRRSPEAARSDDVVRKYLRELAPDLADELDGDPGPPPVVDLVVVEPAWLLTTGEVFRWCQGAPPEVREEGEKENEEGT